MGNARILAQAVAAPLPWRNKLHNGAFDIWQRGISFTGVYTNQYNSYYGADRWQMFRAGGIGGATFSKTAWGGGLDFVNAARMQRNPGDSSVMGINIAQSLETNDIQVLRGKVVTLSFKYYLAANFSGGVLGVSANMGTGTDGNLANGFTGASGITGSYLSVSGIGALQSASVTFTVPSNATQLGINFGYTPSGTAGANDYAEITNVQLELGSIATPYERRPVALELATCQRFFEPFGGVAASPSNDYRSFYFKVTKRGQPAIKLVNGSMSGTGMSFTVLAGATDRCYQESPNSQISNFLAYADADI